MRHRTTLLAIILLGAALLIALSVLASKSRPTINRTAAPAAGSGLFPMTLTDALGHALTIPRKPQRLISLAPNVTEIIYAIGAGDRLIANTRYCDYPPEARALPKVGGYIDPDVEKIIAMQPDLVLGARGNARDALDRLHELNVPLLTVEPEMLAECEHAMLLVGKAVGNGAQAEQQVAAMRQRRAAVEAQVRNLPEAKRPRVLLLFTMHDLYSAGPGSHIDEMVTMSGGRNIAAVTNAPWPELSMETIVTQDPQIILMLTGHGVQNRLTPERVLAELRADPRWRRVTAVRTGRVAMLDEDEITIPGPRMIDGLESMARALHPDRFPAGGAR
jgi:iron complex transport system substrate-binding protein